VVRGTEPTPGARAQEAARLVSQFLGDMCVVEAMRQAVEAADRQLEGMLLGPEAP
jgi:hypothetical protein